MEQDKKQKVMIAILAIAGLGAGSYYFMTRDSGDNKPVASGAETGRKERKASADSGKKEERKDKKEVKAAAPEPVGRKERETKETADSGRKGRGPKNTENVKKSLPPPDLIMKYCAVWRSLPGRAVLLPRLAESPSQVPLAISCLLEHRLSPRFGRS